MRFSSPFFIFLAYAVVCRSVRSFSFFNGCSIGHNPVGCTFKAASHSACYGNDNAPPKVSVDDQGNMYASHNQAGPVLLFTGVHGKQLVAVVWGSKLGTAITLGTSTGTCIAAPASAPAPDRPEVPFVVSTRYPHGQLSVTTLGRTRPRGGSEYGTPLVSVVQETEMTMHDVAISQLPGIAGKRTLPPIALFGLFGQLVLSFAPGVVSKVQGILGQDLRGERVANLMQLPGVQLNATAGTITVNGDVIQSEGTAAKTEGDLSDAGLLMVIVF